MSKLYQSQSQPEIEIGTIVNNGSAEVSEVDLQPLEEATDTLAIVGECLKETANNLNIANTIQTDLSQRKLASVDYFVSLENYTPVIRTIAGGLGVRVPVASLEDFSNGYSTQSSHDVAMEGIKEFIANLWKKFKDLMSTFFKKVREFVRRLNNANLELDTYEKYIPALISKIKSEKLKVVDNTPSISSKLPSLLAFEGMNEVDSDFVLSNGQRSLESLNEVLNLKLKFGLANLNKIELVAFRKQLEKLTETDLSKVDPAAFVSEVKEELGTVVGRITKTLTPIPYASNEIPEEAYEALSSLAYDSRISNLRVHGLVEPNDSQTKLPKNFNLLIAEEPGLKIYGVATTRYTEVTNNSLGPISNIQNLITFYEFYKKFSKQVNVKELDNLIGDTEKALDDTIKVMQVRYAQMLDKIKTTKSVNGYTKEQLSRVLHEALLDTNLYANVSFNATGVYYKFSEKVSKLFTNGNGLDPDHATEVIAAQGEIDAVITGIMQALADTKDGPTKGKAQIALAKILGNTEQPVDPETMGKLIETLTTIEKYVLSFFQALQVVIRGLGANLIATYTECRYEMARYIYQSAKRYG